MDSPAAPPSWKTKCTIRRVDDLGRFVNVAPGADVVSTLEMAGAPPRPKHVASIAPFVVDIDPFGIADSLAFFVPPAFVDDDIFAVPPANRDVMGIRSTRPATKGIGGHFWAGLVAGALTLFVGGGIAYTALASDALPVRERHVAVHLTATLERSSLDPSPAAVTPDMLPNAL